MIHSFISATAIALLFSLPDIGHAATLSVLHTFSNTDGRAPQGLTVDSQGNVYGITNFGINNNGTVFKVTANNHQFSTIARFDGISGSDPISNLIVDSNDNLYGITLYSRPYDGTPGNNGTLFKVDTVSNALTTLATFTSPNWSRPSSIIRDSSGRFYGTTVFGGDITSNTRGGYGTVFEIPVGNTTPTNLYVFENGADGKQPSDLIMDAAGNLFGTSRQTIFKIDSITHQYNLIASLSGTNLYDPQNLAFDSAGNLYGTAEGGTINAGVIFKIPAGTTNLEIIASFGGTNGYAANSLLIDAAGNIFGTTGQGGIGFNAPLDYGNGTVFKIAAGTNTITNLVMFTGMNGIHPESLVADGQGNLYGTTISGTKGRPSAGTVFMLTDTGFVVPEVHSLFTITVPILGLFLHRRLSRSLNGSP